MSDEPIVPAGDKAVDVALAEFKALRDEIIGAFNKQGAIIALGVAALGVLFTAALKTDGDPRLLLAVPPLAMAVSLLHTAEWARFMRVGQYIRTELWPYLQKQTGYDKSWESHIFHSTRSFGWRDVIQRICTEGVVAPILLTIAAVCALVYYSPRHIASGWLYLEWATIAVGICVPIGFWLTQIRQNG